MPFVETIAPDDGASRRSSRGATLLLDQAMHARTPRCCQHHDENSSPFDGRGEGRKNDLGYVQG